MHSCTNTNTNTNDHLESLLSLNSLESLFCCCCSPPLASKESWTGNFHIFNPRYFHDLQVITFILVRPLRFNEWKWLQLKVYVSTLATALFCINVISIFVFALISISLFVFLCVLYLYLNSYLYLRSKSHLCQWCQLRQLEYHNSPRGLVWGDWYDFGGSNIWKKFDDWMILEEHIFG